MRSARRRGVLNSVSGFNPLDLNPALWLDAADTTTITASGSPLRVSQWNDKSGNGRNVTQGTGGSQPATGTQTLNGLNVIDFEEARFMSRASPWTLTSYSAFSVFVPITLSNANFVIVSSLSPGSSASGVRPTLSVYDNQFQSPLQSANNAAALGTAAQLTSIQTANSQTVRWNGTQVASDTRASSLNALNELTIARPEAIGSYQIGRKLIAEFVVCDYVLTATQRDDLEAYLKNKWGTP